MKMQTMQEFNESLEEPLTKFETFILDYEEARIRVQKNLKNIRNIMKANQIAIKSLLQEIDWDLSALEHTSYYIRELRIRQRRSSLIKDLEIKEDKVE